MSITDAATDTEIVARTERDRQKFAPALANSIARKFSVVGGLRPRLAAEESDNYPRLVATLNNRWRVIVCKDGIQWVLQCRPGRSANGWRGRSYCHTREALLRRARQQAGSVDDVALAILLRLPGRIGSVP